MSDLISKIMESQEPARRVSPNAQELERLIVIQPTYTTFDMIPVIAHWKQHGTLEGFDTEKIKEIVQRERGTISALSDAFKRILLFETAAYISGTYAIQFSNETSTSDWVTKLNRARISLMSDSDYSQAHKEIVQAFEGLKGKVFLDVIGRAESMYLSSVRDVLKLCALDKGLEAINAGFAGRQIYFSINEYGEYTGEMKKNPDFAQFARSYRSLFKPVSGYILFKSPEIVEYAGIFLDEFKRKHHVVDPNEITISGRSPLEFFRGLSRRAD